MTAGVRPTLGHAFRRAALPLGCYYAVTLALPLANGASQAGGAFVGHALIVLVVPPILIVLMCAVRIVISVVFPFDMPLERGDTPLAWLIERRPRPTCSRARSI
jgi:hypothetical protein